MLCKTADGSTEGKNDAEDEVIVVHYFDARSVVITEFFELAAVDHAES